LWRSSASSSKTGPDRIGRIEIAGHDGHRFEPGEQQRRRFGGRDLDRPFVTLEHAQLFDFVKVVPEDPDHAGPFDRRHDVLGCQPAAVVEEHSITDVDLPRDVVRCGPPIRQFRPDRKAWFKSDQTLVDRRHDEPGDGIGVGVGIHRHQLVGIGHAQALHRRRLRTADAERHRHDNDLERPQKTQTTPPHRRSIIHATLELGMRN